jgi:hypothetical protein
MSAENTLEALGQYCKNQTGDTQQWSGKSGTYRWNTGRPGANGLVNGVVRKLAGTDVSGKNIWAVAGSFKIDPSGKILRFTGLSKKEQELLNRIGVVTIQATQAVEQEA